MDCQTKKKTFLYCTNLRNNNKNKRLKEKGNKRNKEM